jgi:apurinic endonuclease APN1
MQEIYYIDWEVGSHSYFLGNIEKTLREGIRLGMHTIQFFMGDSKQAWKRDEITDIDIEKSKKIITRFPMNVFTHYPFCANLAGQASKGCLAWNGNADVDRKVLGMIRALEYELSVVAQLSQKRSGVVIHPGSYPNREEGHIAVAKTLNKINFPPNSILLLENCAGEGNKLCRTFQEIKTVLELLEPIKKQHVKVCVDTAHIWGQGDYDLREISEIDRMFNDFDKLLGMDNFYLLHLNDSLASLGSKKDLHACLGEGSIWKHGFQSLVHLLNKCQSNNIPIVLETTDSDMLTIFALQSDETLSHFKCPDLS